jgi:hypothetical protein
VKKFLASASCNSAESDTTDCTLHTKGSTRYILNSSHPHSSVQFRFWCVSGDHRHIRRNWGEVELGVLPQSHNTFGGHDPKVAALEGVIPPKERS